MNIDDLKNAWNEDDSLDTPEINTEQKKKIHLPLEKMRKNMRMEFWSTVGVFIFAFALIALCEGSFKFKFYIALLIACMVFVTFFFFSQFFKLYKNMSDPMMKTYDNLKDLLDQFNLNKQYYLSFYLSFVPFLVCELIIVLEFLPHRAPLSELKTAVIVLGTVVTVLPVLFWFGTWWFKKLYGVHIARIENLLTVLKK